MNDKCVFYKNNNGDVTCAYTNRRKCCFICLDFMAPIGDLTIKEHFSLNENRRGRFITLISLIFSVIFSAGALTISIITYFFKD